MLKNKKEVIKHSGAIHIQGKTTHLQRRAWNVLLANAYDELPTQEVHSASITEVMEKLEFDSNNRNYMKKTLEELQGCQVKWNILGKDGSEEEWGVTSLLAEAKISKGVCSYAYGPTLRERLYNPKMYAKINLRLQNQFKGKYGLILWEICVDYLDESRGYGETPYIPLETLKNLMGIDEDEYSDFKRLNRDVIRKAVAEINKLTAFHVDVEYQRRGRRVVAVKFKIQQLKQIPQQDRKQEELFPELKTYFSPE